MKIWAKIGTILSFAAVVLVSIPAVRACSWSYVLWGIRSKPADPLFRFVRQGRAGYIDSSGKIVIQPTLPAGDNSSGEFHEGLVAIKEDGTYRYLDRTGKVVFKMSKSDAWIGSEFSEGLARAAKYDGLPKWGFIDRSGRFAIPPRYSWVDSFSDGLARVSVASEVGTTGYIDKAGNFVIPPNLSYGSGFHDGRAAVILGGPCRITNGGSCARAEFRPTLPNPIYDCRYAFVDKKGDPISELRFDDAKDFSEGFGAVRIGKLWGYVDRSGRISISPQFEIAESFSEGIAAVHQNGKVGFIDPSGHFVILPQFKFADSFSDGRAIISESDGAGESIYRFIDRTGKAAFPGEFSAAVPFSYGLAHVALRGRSKGTFAWINTLGKPVLTYTPR